MWMAASAMSTARRGHTAAAIFVGNMPRRIYVVGGCSGATCVHGGNLPNVTNQVTALSSGEALLMV